MTSNKRFKRRVRERAAKTGESYTTARTHLSTGGSGGSGGGHGGSYLGGPAGPPDDDAKLLEVYLADVRAIAPIDQEEERALLARARAGDTSASRTVVTALLAPAADVALPLAGPSGLRELEALAEANAVVLRLVEGDEPLVSGRLEEAIREKLSTP